MTWPILSTSTVVAEVLGTTVLFSQHTGVLATVNDVGAFVLNHREHFASRRDAAEELTALLGADAGQVEMDLRKLDEALTALGADGPAAFDPLLGPERQPPSLVPAARWTLDALGVSVEVRCYDAHLAGVIAPLLAAHPPSSTPPQHRFDIWDDDGITVTQDDREIAAGVPVDVAVNALTAGLTVLTILAERELLLFHGAAVADGDATVMLGGGSGAGKTTTAVELVAGGMSFLTDELVELDPASRAVRGLARPFGLEGPARARRPELRPAWALDEDLVRWPVPPHAVGHVVERGHLALIVHLEFTDSTTSVEALDPLEALGHLCLLTFNRHRLTVGTLAHLADLVTVVPSIVVRHDGATGAARTISQQWRQVRGVRPH
jgi:hypothetical protein